MHGLYHQPYGWFSTLESLLRSPRTLQDPRVLEFGELPSRERSSPQALKSPDTPKDPTFFLPEFQGPRLQGSWL